jgi:NADP-dependent aldehyde dehydrogenase
MTAQLQGIDPRTGVKVGPPVPPTTAGELASAVAAADRAAPVLAALSPADRAGALRAVAAVLDGAADEMVELADRETGLGPARLRGEVARTTGQLRFLGEVVSDGAYLGATIDHADPSATPPRPDLRLAGVPLGPVVVFAASNFPFAFSVAGGDTASALATGCPVLLKAHPGHPATSLRTAELVSAALASAGFPAGAFALVNGVDAGREALLDPRVRAGAFTGSLAGGRALFDLAAGRPEPIPFYGELGSINPVVITPAAAAARTDELADGLTGSFTLGTGQFCTKPGLVFVPAGSGLPAAVAERVGGLPAGPMLGDRLASGYRDGRDALAGTSGVRTLAFPPGDESAPGAWARPAVFGTDVATFLRDPSVLLTECFGPATVLVEWASADELLAALERLEGSLTATIHADDADDPALVAMLAHTLPRRCGRLVWGGWPTGVAVTWAMHHGGPYPATTMPAFTSVGAAAVARFLRPVSYQNVPDRLLPAVVREANPLGIVRRVDGAVVLAGQRPTP